MNHWHWKFLRAMAETTIKEIQRSWDSWATKELIDLVEEKLIEAYEMGENPNKAE